MIDMHCHILPAIDDGAKDIETSIEMLKIAACNGTTAIVATPHVIEGAWLPSWELILQKCQELQLAARQEGIAISLYPGAEVAIHLDMLERLTKPGPYCVNGGSYVLLELPAVEIPNYTEDFFFTLQTRGISPILVHPERHPMIIRNPEILLDWVKKGLLVQLNAPSLTGKMGAPVMRTAELLLKSNLVHVLGSDAHSKRTRNPNLSEAVAKLAGMNLRIPYHEIICDNPLAIVESQEIAAREVNALCRNTSNKGSTSWMDIIKNYFR